MQNLAKNCPYTQFMDAATLQSCLCKVYCTNKLKKLLESDEGAGNLLRVWLGDAYSLEEARKKKEQDKLQAAADAKKQGVKAYVADLRK